MRWSSSEVSVRYLAKQTTSLVKCTDTLPMSSSIAILTFGRGTELSTDSLQEPMPASALYALKVTTKVTAWVVLPACLHLPRVPV